MIDKGLDNRNKHYFVIPVETGIQSVESTQHLLDSRLRGNDGFVSGLS